MFLIEGYCLEGIFDCSVMSISASILILDIIRLLVQVIRAQLDKPKPAQQGKYLCFQFWIKMISIWMLFGASITQILVWILIEKSTQSILLLQMFAMNTFCCCLWTWAIYQDKVIKGATRLRTLANMSINLLSNIMVALLTSRNILDNKDDFTFYLYAIFIGASSMTQLFLYQRPKDILPILLNDLGEKLTQDNNLSIDHHNSSTGVGRNSANQEEMSTDNIDEKNDLNDTDDNNNNLSNDIKINEKSLQQKGIQAEEEQKESIESQNKGFSEVNNRNSQERSQGDPQQIKQKKEMTITQVRIDKFVEMIKYSKKTIMFEVKFTSNSRMNVVKHSFREFIQLKAALSSKFPSLKFPPFPPKQPQNSILTFNDLEERRKQLSFYLQEIIKLILPSESLEMKSFFFAQGDVEEKNSTSPSLKKIPLKKSQSEEPSQTTFQNIPETIWEEDEEHTLSLEEKKLDIK